MSAFVIDASIAVAIISPDERNERVSMLLDRIIDHGAFAPALWLFEAANAVRNKWAKSELPATAARDALEKLHALPIDIVDLEPPVLRGGVMALAYRRNLTIYDASYLHLASILSLPISTFDKVLIAAAPQEGVEVMSI